jgi:flavocytochrome c
VGDEESLLVDASFYEQRTVADAIVVGSGLAGLTSALTILDRGGTVWIIEKEPILGGNSNKASSGINGCCFQNGNTSILTNISQDTMDTTDLFYDDTSRSAGDVADATLIETLVQGSGHALKWLTERVHVDLSAPVVQLGGHSRKRTHRPNQGFVGAEVMNAMETAIRKYEKTGHARILVGHKVTRLIKNSSGHVKGVKLDNADPHAPSEFDALRTDHVILATGGFASDRSTGSLLRQYRPELQNMAATAGSFSTGDGIRLALELGATTRDMAKIQIHPTGFVDPTDSSNPHKVLAAELLRGVGGILLNKQGNRFCNELGKRDYVTDKMLEHDAEFMESRIWNPEKAIPTFYMVLSGQAAQKAQKHIDTYMRQGLITKIDGLKRLSSHLNVDKERITSTIRQYQRCANNEEKDVFRKTVFENVPNENLDEEEFFVGEVTPVLHYCMGGLKISPSGRVIASNQETILGLYAVGEVTGGVHGNNRLGGNSLLECVVFGKIVGEQIPVTTMKHLAQYSERLPSTPGEALTVEEMSRHNTPIDCLVGLNGNVYNLTTFTDRHPGGRKSIVALCGTEATEIFLGVHSLHILSVVDDHRVGYLSDYRPTQLSHDNEVANVDTETLKQHNSPDDCWVVIHGMVYDLTEFSKNHPGGAYIIQKLAGRDATVNYQVFHPKEKLTMIQGFLVGKFTE